MATNWTPTLSFVFEIDATDKMRLNSDEGSTIFLVDQLENEDYDVYFWGPDDVDRDGHLYGFTPETPEYLATLEVKDKQL